jgi:excinuclease UvrABC nuclease subunit
VLRQPIAEAEWSDKPGVYVVFEAEGDTQPLYVGGAAKQSLRRRWQRQHLASRSGSSALRRSVAVYRKLVKDKLKRPNRSYPPQVEEDITIFLKQCFVELHPTETPEQALALEAKLIASLGPVLNVAHPKLAEDATEPSAG